MASGSGRGHGRDGPRRSISMRGKGPMIDNLGRDDTAYHEYLQRRAYAEDLGLNSPTPPLIISEPNPDDTPPGPNLTSQSDNMPYIDTATDFRFDPQEPGEQEDDLIQRQQSKSDLFVKHFKKIRQEDGSIAVACNYCNKVYKWHKSGGYGSYRKHLLTKHPEAETRSRSQTQIPRYATPNQQLFRYTDEQNREELARMVAVEHLSFSFGERVGFVNYCRRALNPAACRVPRSTLTSTLEKIYNKEKIKLVKIFDKHIGRVSVCADIWTDHWKSHSYLGVTCHFMDDTWTIQKRILAFRVFDDAHTAHNIFRQLRVIFAEYNIESKIFAIGFDNASANTAAIPSLLELCKPYLGGTFFHQRCACHVLNLCVQKGLETLEHFILPIKKALMYLWKHSSTMNEWVKYCKQNGRRVVRFPRDVPTRWNSTYKLLAQSYAYRDLLVSFIQFHVTHIQLYQSHWDACYNVFNLLSIFNNATQNLSGVYYPTTHLFIFESINIAGAFRHCESDISIGEAVHAMKKKWLDYYAEIPNIYLIAMIFDPRCKLESVSYYLNGYYGVDGLKMEYDIDACYARVKKLLYDLYDEYLIVYGSSLNLNVTHTQTTSQAPKSKSSGFIELGYSMLSKKSKKPRCASSSNTDKYSELESYLNTSYEFVDDGSGKTFEILKYWKENAVYYPIMAMIAKNIFSTPVSTVAVEQEFSAGGNILDEQRSCLTPKSLQMQVCIDDWTKAQYRQQELQQDPTYDFFKDDEPDAAEPE